MKHVKKSVLLWYSPAEMFALVTDVARYPEFLPWCERGEVRNEHVPDRQLLMRLVDGPFSLLDGTWDFLPLGNGQPPACKIEFDLQYAFASRPLEVVLSPVFDKVANTFVDAFVKRAEQVYGER
jgi:ribosome-associated toxin RatA of RatAB toxin-antitoxin module